MAECGRGCGRFRERVEDREVVFSGRVVTVRVDQVRLEDGLPARREVVVHTGSVGIVAVGDDGRVPLIRQYRHPVETDLWEIPAGRVDDGEEAACAARRELVEETGLAAAQVTPLLDLFVSPGYCTERIRLFYATGLTQGESSPDPGERIKVHWFDLQEAIRMCLDGRVRDAKTIAGLLALRVGGTAPPGEQ